MQSKLFAETCASLVPVIGIWLRFSVSTNTLAAVSPFGVTTTRPTSHQLNAVTLFTKLKTVQPASTRSPATLTGNVASAALAAALAFAADAW